MRNALLISVAVGGAWLAACSKPAPESSASRDIRLATPASAGAPTVSTLESGNTRLAPPAPRVRRADPAPEPVLERKLPVVAEVGLPKVVSAVSPANASLAEAPDHLPMAAMPAAAMPEEDHGSGSARVVDDAYRHGGTIMIRGGLGGIDDKCDLRPRGYRGGIAINRMTPPLSPGGIH